jgi:nitroimidazol reductase NimA-like FMN-containing flavoprotein (pyridoxamine 5'-phosphate oxidase superfamily)
MSFDMDELIAGSRIGILATIKRDGHPQLSPVQPYYDRAAGIIYVSMTEGRAKTANLRRDQRVSHGPEVAALVDYYRAAAGEHPDWEEYRAVMVADRRVLMTMTVEKVYGQQLR